MRSGQTSGQADLARNMDQKVCRRSFVVGRWKLVLASLTNDQRQTTNDRFLPCYRVRLSHAHLLADECLRAWATIELCPCSCRDRFPATWARSGGWQTLSPAPES